MKGSERKSLFESGIFPVQKVSEEGAREKNIRQGGHPSTLHIWWARRPLTAVRAGIYALLVPAPEEPKERERKRQFIQEFSKWEESNNPRYIRKAREEIRKIYKGIPKVLDPFAGGGSLPLEALRLGCLPHAIDYNPVATLILKCTLEYPQRFREKNRIGKYQYRLLEDVERWGNWILEKVGEEIGRFYPRDEDGSIPVAYIWARTLPCQNPLCGAEIPLMRQFRLAYKPDKKIALKPKIVGKRVEFEIVESPSDFDPKRGTVSRAIVECPVCHSMIDDGTTRRLFREGKGGERLVAVVVYKGRGREYRLANERDLEVFREAEEYLKEKREKLWEEWGFDPVPDEPTPLGKGRGAERFFNMHRYGLNSFCNLFNSRQKLALISFSEKFRQAYQEMEKEEMEEEYMKAVASYLALTISRVSDFQSTLCRWVNAWETIAYTMSMAGLIMMMDYGELNPFSPILSGTFKSMQGQVLDVLNFLLSIPPLEEDGLIPDVRQGSATELPYPDEYFDAVITDPPYYDNVPYAYLSDFFYVWLKRMLYDIHPELFSTPLTPKSKEIVAYTMGKIWEEAKKEFEEKLSLAFKEIQRVLKPDAPALIIYAHKSTSGWETLINALLDSGLLPTATLPIDTEQAKRLRAQESAALASSLFIACRKKERKGIGWLRDVREELRQYLPEKLKRLWDEGIRGADFLIAGIGVAIEVFGKYEIVMDAEGNVLGADKMLDMVRAMVADFALREALQDGIADKITPMTRFYLLWRHIYGNASVIFDDAKKLAQSVGIDLAKEFNKGFIRKEKENIKLLPPTERREEELKESRELIDILHYALLLWRAGKREEMRQLISRNGSSDIHALEKVAQAIASALPTDNQERRLLEGFLASKEFIPREGTLF